jgi:23S rRNA (guanosine2251-2'-O)-methyltransferase
MAMQNEHPLSFREARPDSEERREKLSEDRNPLYLILDGLSDPRNVGSLFRLADAGRLAGIYLVGMDEGLLEGKAGRVARATMSLVPHWFVRDWEDWKVDSPELHLFALEWTNQSLPYHLVKPVWPGGLVIGNEQRGVSPEGLRICQGSLHIPMLGLNSSMNVSVATGIAVYGMLQQGGMLKE